ncbi:MAG: hypothetical protein R6V60_06295 [Desulfobacterales bacterium]
MTVKLDVPEDRLGSFQRMKRQLPLEIREDPEVLRKLLIYLKLGGDRLVRQFVATVKTEFPEDTQLFKRRIADDNLDDGDATEADADQDPVVEDADDSDADNQTP